MSMLTQLRTMGTSMSAAYKCVAMQNMVRNNFGMLNVMRSQKRINLECTLTQKSIYSFASFKEKLEKKQKDKSEEDFKKEIEFLANKPSFTLVDFKQRIIDQLSKMKKGLKAKLISGQQENEAALTKQKTLLNALTDDELLDSSRIGQTEKKQIAMIAQCEIQDVNKLLQSFQNLKQSHNFLRKCKEKGQPLPETAEELQWKFRQEKDISYAFKKSIQAKQRGRSKAQYRKLQKWSKRLRL